MLEAIKLVRNYGSTRALADFTLTAKPGTIIGLVGPNGAGKTTALRILACIDRPDSGSLSIAGTDALKNPDAARSRIGYMPEQFPFDPDIRVSEYLDFVASMRGLVGIQKAAALDSVFGICELDTVRGKLMGSLSKGFRQRVGLAQALVHQPELLILDEPASGMDPIQAARFRDTLFALRINRTIIFSTHQLSDAESICDEIHVVSAGVLRGKLDNSRLGVQDSGVPGPMNAPESRDSQPLLAGYGKLISLVEGVKTKTSPTACDLVVPVQGLQCMKVETASLNTDQKSTNSHDHVLPSSLNSFLALARRESLFYLHSSALWIVAAIQLVISASWLFFGREYFASGVASLSGWFASLPFILTVTYSLLFSRIWAEEFRHGSFDLLAGYPVRNRTLVYGKYAGSMLAACFSLLPLSILPLTVGLVSPLDPAPVLAGFSGIFLFSFFVIAITNFASSLTSSSAVAFSLSTTSVFALLVIEKIGYWVGAFTFFPALTTRLSASRHLLSFFRGAIDSYDTLYFLLGSALALFYTELSLERRRK